jgi:hypothetical protein
MNLPLDVETVIICDDIRQERNGKYLLIGVYGGNIAVGGFPADIVLAIWLLAQPKSVGQHQIKIRVVGPQNSTLVEGTLEVDLNDMNKAAIFALPGMPIQLQREGKLRLSWLR